MPKKPKLTVVQSNATGTQPPRTLGQHGRKLWDSVQSEFDIRDVGGVEMLALACGALDRAEACREQIDADGEVLHTKSGLREHPLLKGELANRSFVARTLTRLGINLEAVKPVGRPAATSWSG